eukprot:scaffold32217_cov41-Cyclotella_meneghiniana.AAC.1
MEPNETNQTAKVSSKTIEKPRSYDRWRETNGLSLDIRAKIQQYYLLTWMLMAELCRSRSRPPLAPIIKELHHALALAIKKATLSSDSEEGLIVATTFFF